MKRLLACLMIVGIGIGGNGYAQPAVTTPAAPGPGGHPPPPQAYADCKGKQAGDAVQHQTPEGVVPATCETSPEGLVARPRRPPGAIPRNDREK